MSQISSYITIVVEITISLIRFSHEHCIFLVVSSEMVIFPGKYNPNQKHHARDYLTREMAITLMWLSYDNIYTEQK